MATKYEEREVGRDAGNGQFIPVEVADRRKRTAVETGAQFLDADLGSPILGEEATCAPLTPSPASQGRGPAPG